MKRGAPLKRTVSLKRSAMKRVSMKPARPKPLTPLQKAARGQECDFRIPGVCNRDPATTVLCHIRRGGAGGMGKKPNDLQAARGCSSCHDVVDYRNTMGGYTPAEIDGFIVDAQQKWLGWVYEELKAGRLKLV